MNLPSALARIPHEDVCTHVYLEVLTRKKWVIVDSTWDKGLSKVFKINNWDGKSDTSIAVRPSRVYSPSKSKELIEKESKEDIKLDLKKNGKFYSALNDSLSKIRKNH